jgi:hypothetical protein
LLLLGALQKRTPPNNFVDGTSVSPGLAPPESCCHQYAFLLLGVFAVFSVVYWLVSFIYIQHLEVCCVLCTWRRKEHLIWQPQCGGSQLQHIGRGIAGVEKAPAAKLKGVTLSHCYIGGLLVKKRRPWLSLHGMKATAARTQGSLWQEGAVMHGMCLADMAVVGRCIIAVDV